MNIVGYIEATNATNKTPKTHTMTNKVKVQVETFIDLLGAVKAASLSELYKLEKRVDRHFNAGTLSLEGFFVLDVLIMEEIAAFNSLVK